MTKVEKMDCAVFVYERDKTFDYGAFTKHLVKSGNVVWEGIPGRCCQRPRFRKAVEIELGVDTDTAQDIVETMIDLGMIHVDTAHDVHVKKALR